MAIFAIRSAQNVNEDSIHISNHNTPKRSDGTSRSAAAIPEPVIQFDDDMAHFVTHLDADPLAESQLKMQLVECDYPTEDGNGMVREITDDEDDYTFLSFKKLSYAAVTALLPPSRTPTPVDSGSGDRPTSAHSARKASRQRDFTASILLDNEDDGESDWHAHKARRGKSRAKGLAKKRGIKVV